MEKPNTLLSQGTGCLVRLPEHMRTAIDQEVQTYAAKNLKAKQSSKGKIQDQVVDSEVEGEPDSDYEDTARKQNTTKRTRKAVSRKPAASAITSSKEVNSDQPAKRDNRSKQPSVEIVQERPAPKVVFLTTRTAQTSIAPQEQAPNNSTRLHESYRQMLQQKDAELQFLRQQMRKEDNRHSAETQALQQEILQLKQEAAQREKAEHAATSNGRDPRTDTFYQLVRQDFTA